jgi:hypothetical protein
MLSFSPNYRISGLKLYSFRNPYKIELKIFDRDSSEVLGTFIILKWRVNLGVKFDLPPPGGAAEQINTAF